MEAERGLSRIAGIARGRLHSVRIIGDGYNLSRLYSEEGGGMSWSVDLFVDAQDPMPQFVRDVESACNVKFTPAPALTRPSGMSIAQDSLGVVCLRDDHEAPENDRGINFEDYRYELNVRPYRTTDWERDQKAGDELAARLFEQLKATGRYRLMLVEELQKRLQVFDPQAAV